MANVAAYKAWRTWERKKEYIEIVYDFTKDGGATGALGMIQFDHDVLIHSAKLAVNVGVTSGGSATVEVGVSGDTAVLIAQAAKTAVDAKGEVLPANFVGEDAYYLVKDTDIILTIATAALTAGKLTLILEVSKLTV